MSDDGLLPQPEGIDDLAYYWRCLASAQAKEIEAMPRLVEALEHVLDLLATWGEDDPEQEIAVINARAALTSIGRKP